MKTNQTGFLSPPTIFTDEYKEKISGFVKNLENNIRKNIIIESKLLSDYKKSYDEITSLVFNRLKKYNWLITPNIPWHIIQAISKIPDSSNRIDSKINSILTAYYFSNNGNILLDMLNRWEKNSLYKKRIIIFKNCIQSIIVCNKRNINIIYVVLPTLISQLDGILTDYLKLKGVIWKSLFGDKQTGRKLIFNDQMNKVLNEKFDSLAKDVFLEVLLHKSQENGKDIDIPLNYNRHRIIHGQFTNYGKKTYLLRTLLLIDYFSYLK